ncbi:MAG: DUF3108 domain-containing protein [Gemmatimonadetes bacterium]|nr:DUF3108 domain-containing protein [Gemmatimonadota bacterium]MCC6770930.1 DUF3108 domain-containing protein [Gemmatimonadaceae bacterium]
MPSTFSLQRSSLLRRTLAPLAYAWLVVAALSPRVPLQGQTNGASHRTAFAIGEQMVYDVKFGVFNVGTARMEVMGIDTVRGRRAWHTKLEIEGGIPGYRVHDILESWIDVETFRSLRHRQETVEGRREKTRVFEIMPERGVYREDDKPELPTVADPLDEGAFIFFVRNQPLDVGRTYDFNRYFIPDRNPVTVKVDRRQTMRVPAGSFETIVVKPIIKSKGVFSKNGRAEIWFTDDDRRLMVRMETHVVFGTISLQLREFSQGNVLH